MHQDADYLTNEKVKNLMIQVGEIYPAVAQAHHLCEDAAKSKQQEREIEQRLAQSEQQKKIIKPSPMPKRLS